MSELECSIIIVNYNSPELIAKCLETIDQYLKGLKKEIIIVDNNSHDQSLVSLQNKYNFVKVIYLHENMGFGYANNVGSRNASSDTLLLLNSDTELIDSTLESTIKSFRDLKEKIMWGVILKWPSGKFQNSYCNKITFLNFLTNYTPIYFFSRFFKVIKAHKYFDEEFDTLQEVDVIYGTMMLVRKNDFEALGGFAKKYFMYFEDIDFCDRFKNELMGKIFINPASAIIHNVKGSAGKKIAFNKMYMKSKITYGVSRFGFLKMFFFIVPDYFLENIRILFKKFKTN